MSDSFKEIVQQARVHTAALLEEMKNIANGTAILFETKVVDGDKIEYEVSPKFSERVAAFKTIKDITMHRESLAVKEKDELDMMSPYERLKLYEDAAEEARQEISNLQ